VFCGNQTAAVLGNVLTGKNLRGKIFGFWLKFGEGERLIGVVFGIFRVKIILFSRFAVGMRGGL
jgi:hypothetical protein